MTADGSGCRAGCVKQHRFEGASGLPACGIGFDQFCLQLQAGQIFRDTGKASGAIDGNDVGSAGCELCRLSTGGSTKVGNVEAGYRTQQTGGQGGSVLHPPRALREARQFVDASSVTQSQ